VGFSRRLLRILRRPLVAALITMVPGLIGWALGQVLLFPSLGPTALMQVHIPEHASSRPYNVIVSHTIGILAGFVSVDLFGLAAAPSVFATHTLPLTRVLAVALAILVGTAAEVALRAQHPPAAATTLLAALGSFRPTFREFITVLAGVLLVACAGEFAKRKLV
jgi:CBS-domain-containing membrane protein